MSSKKGIRVSKKFIKLEISAERGKMIGGIFTDLRIPPLSIILFKIWLEEEEKKFQKMSPDKTYKG
jgi:hypothetical protein